MPSMKTGALIPTENQYSPSRIQQSTIHPPPSPKHHLPYNPPTKTLRSCLPKATPSMFLTIPAPQLINRHPLIHRSHTPGMIPIHPPAHILTIPMRILLILPRRDTIARDALKYSPAFRQRGPHLGPIGQNRVVAGLPNRRACLAEPAEIVHLVKLLPVAVAGEVLACGFAGFEAGLG